MSLTSLQIYEKMRQATPVIVIEKNKNETFPSVRVCAAALDLPEITILNAIKNGYKVKTSVGDCYFDILQS